MNARSAERLADELDTAATASRFSGVVTLRVGAEPVLERAYGLADRANGLENTTRTRFGTASATKTFTALAVCALIESGRAAFDDSVVGLLDVNIPGVAPEVTVEHLLTHTSGIGDCYDEDAVTDFDDYFVSIPWYRLERPRDYLPLIADLPPKFAPGERFSYCNSGFVLLGLVVEELAGVPYQEYVRARVFERAGMASSGFFRLDALPESTALGYIGSADGAWRTNVYNLPVVGGPDGGAFCTAADMTRFWSALHADRIVGRDWRERILTPRVATPTPGCSCGLGVWIREAPSGPPFALAEGADAGVTFTSVHGAAAGLEYTVACNAPPSAAAITEILDGAFLAAAG